MIELENIFKAEQVNISKSKWGFLTDSYQRRLNAEIELNGGSTKYNLNGVHILQPTCCCFLFFLYCPLWDLFVSQLIKDCVDVSVKTFLKEFVMLSFFNATKSGFNWGVHTFYIHCIRKFWTISPSVLLRLISWHHLNGVPLTRDRVYVWLPGVASVCKEHRVI